MHVPLRLTLLGLIITNWAAIDAVSQTNFYGTIHSRYGLNVKFFEGWTTIGGNIAVPIQNKQSRIVFKGSVSLLEEDQEAEEFGLSTPPIPHVSIAIAETKALWKTGLDYSSYIGIYYTSGRLLENNTTIFTSKEGGIESSIGIFKRLPMSSDLVAIPFFEIATELGVRSTNDNLFGVKETDFFWESEGSAIGLIFDFPPDFSVWGAFGFYFDDSDQTFSIGVNWY